MASTSDQCSALGNDSSFRNRVMSLALQLAQNQIYSEDVNTVNHTQRVNYARTVINGGGGNIPNIISNGPNLIASNITYDFTDGHIKTDATDAAISSQISSYWNMLAGV